MTREDGAFAIFGCARHASSAIDDLTLAIADRSDEVSWWATRAIWQIGPEAIPSLEKRIRKSKGRGRRRLQLALDALRTADEPRFRVFAKVPKLVHLEVFVHVGEVLALCGPTSWKRLERIFEERKLSGGTMHLQSYSANYLASYMRELSIAIDVPLIAKGGHRTSLSDAGRELLPLAKEFLELKRVEEADNN